VPTYQYACTACDERLEVVQKFTDDPLSECDVCGGRLRKLFSPVGIVFKGSGFYRTDSRNASAANGHKAKPLNGDAKDSAAAGEKSAGGDSGAKSGETKPEKKASAAGAGRSSSADAKVA
jgi:putative FmdB family regulatory protein